MTGTPATPGPFPAALGRPPSASGPSGPASAAAARTAAPGSPSAPQARPPAPAYRAPPPSWPAPAGPRRDRLWRWLQRDPARGGAGRADRPGLRPWDETLAQAAGHLHP